MINGLDIYYSKNIEKRLKPISKVSGSGLKPISTNKKVSGYGLKPISKGGSCKKVGSGLNFTINLIFINNI